MVQLTFWIFLAALVLITWWHLAKWLPWILIALAVKQQLGGAADGEAGKKAKG